MAARQVQLPLAKGINASVKISIITVSYNSERHIKSAVRSVLAQTYSDIEYLVIDGASKDGTVALVESLRPEFGGRMLLISEPDSGIYDAMNKGLTKATGDIVGFLNSDDELAAPDVIEAVVAKFIASTADIVYGDLVYIDEECPNRVNRVWRTGSLPRYGMRLGWHPPHPSFYVKRNTLLRLGGFDTRYRIGADYEQMLRLLECNKTSAAYLAQTLVKMRIGGVSNRSIGNIIRANVECFRAWQDNGLTPSPFLIPMKLASKVAQKFGHR